MRQYCHGHTVIVVEPFEQRTDLQLPTEVESMRLGLSSPAAAPIAPAPPQSPRVVSCRRSGRRNGRSARRAVLGRSQRVLRDANVVRAFNGERGLRAGDGPSGRFRWRCSRKASSVSCGTTAICRATSRRDSSIDRAIAEPHTAG